MIIFKTVVRNLYGIRKLTGFWRKNYLFKLIICVGSAIVIIFILATFLLNRVERGSRIASEKTYAKLFSQLILHHIEGAMLSGRRDTIESALNELQDSGQILKVEIKDETGRVIFTSRADGIKKGYTTTEPILNQRECHRCHGDERQYLGNLTLVLSLKDLELVQDNHRKVMLGFLVLTLLATSAIITIIILNLQERHERQIRQVDKLASLGTLAAGLAHEINNPLDSLQGCLSRVRKLTGDKKEVTRYLELMSEALTRIEVVVRRLLDFVRPHEITRQPVDLRDTVSEVEALVRYQAARANVKIESEISGSTIVNGDRHLLQEAVFNLALNAVSAMPEGGVLKFRVYPGGVNSSKVILEVIDTGVGIKDEEQKIVFEPFYTTRAKEGGTGLGLPITLNIIKQHEGEIELTSVSGQGSTFRITLPAS